MGKQKSTPTLHTDTSLGTRQGLWEQNEGLVLQAIGGRLPAAPVLCLDWDWPKLGEGLVEDLGQGQESTSPEGLSESASIALSPAQGTVSSGGSRVFSDSPGSAQG